MSIVLKNISKKYENKILFENINLEIDSGEFVTIVGKSGIGKSTLLSIIGSFEKVDDGEVIFNEKSVKKPDRNRIIVFQTFDQLLPWKTVRENIEFPLIHTNSNGLDIEKLLDELDLKSVENLYPHQLSGGMKQRVAIGRSIITKPQVLLMDEPFGSLDVGTRQNLQRLVLFLWKEYKITIVFVTHDVSEAVLLGNRIWILNESEIIEIENPIMRPRDQMAANYQMFVGELIKNIK